MPNEKLPKLRTVNKVKPPYELNNFPQKFAFNVGKEIIYLLASKANISLEGQEWEQIFAKSIGAKWKPSNVGLDDIVLGNCAWGAKTIKAKSPSKVAKVRLISGRNSPVYSFGESAVTDVDPDYLGAQVLSIWNERVSAIRKKYKIVRTVVLIKSYDLTEVALFEFETIRYDPELFYWQWNKRKNLEGFDRHNSEHVFTWQPHGSQFTIKEIVPDDCLLIRVKKPPRLNQSFVLESIGFSNDWITIAQRDG